MRQANQVIRISKIEGNPSIIKSFLISAYIAAFLAAALLITGCGTFQIALEDNTAVPTSVSDPVNPTQASEPEPTEPVTVGFDGQGPFFLGGYFSPGITEAGTVLQVREGVAAFTQSPVAMDFLWDYSGSSGKIAYASEFYHASRDFSRSVTDLWVYDYATDSGEKWLEDDVGRVYWSPYLPESSVPQQLAAAVFDSNNGTFDLLLVDGPGQTRKIANCVSEEFSFSPDGTLIAYKSGWYNESEPRPEECEGAFVVNLSDQSIRRLSDTDPLATGGWFGDQPLWAESLDGLLFKSYNEASIFNLVPLEGSGWYTVAIAASIGEDYLPAPFYSLWSDAHTTVIGQTEGMLDPWGIWVYRLSASGDEIEEAFRIDWGASRHDLILLGWWEPGESVLIRDITYTSGLNPLGEVVVWSLAERKVVDTISIKPEFPMELYPDDVTTGFDEIDVVLRAFLTGSPSDRAALANTITSGCTSELFSVGPPPCEEGMPEGTPLDRFPIHRYREQRYVTPVEISDLMNFGVEGLFAIYKIRPTGFSSEFSPNGEYGIVLLSTMDQKAIIVFVEGGRVVQLDFWELTPPETIFGSDSEYVLPPL